MLRQSTNGHPVIILLSIYGSYISMSSLKW